MTNAGGGLGDERGAAEEQAGRISSRGGRGGGEESEARLQRRLVRGRLEQGRRRRRRRAEEGDAAFCEGFCEEMGPAVLLPRNELPFLRIAFTPCGFSYFQGGYGTIVKVLRLKYQEGYY